MESDIRWLDNLVKMSVDLDNLNLPWKIDLSLYNQIENKELLEHIDRVGVVVAKPIFTILRT
jgi:hypothetical protein